MCERLNMNDHIANPIEYMISLCEKHNLVAKFDIFNAKDELKCLRGGLDYLRKENESLRTKLNSILAQNKNGS